MVTTYYYLWTEEVLGPGVKTSPQIRPSGGRILINNNIGRTDGGAAGRERRSQNYGTTRSHSAGIGSRFTPAQEVPAEIRSLLLLLRFPEGWIETDNRTFG